MHSHGKETSTLIESLVVVAIIVLLVGVLIPVLRKAPFSGAHGVLCVSPAPDWPGNGSVLSKMRSREQCHLLLPVKLTPQHLFPEPFVTTYPFYQCARRRNYLACEKE